MFMARTSGSKVEYAQERADALMREYEGYVGSHSFIVVSEACRFIVSRPCPRFWVSPVRASVVVAALLKGRDVLSSMRPNKREMFLEIFIRVKALRERRPAWSLSRLVTEVVESPAPKFYLTPGSAKIMICKARKEWYRKKNPRLSLS